MYTISTTKNYSVYSSAAASVHTPNFPGKIHPSAAATLIKYCIIIHVKICTKPAINIKKPAKIYKFSSIRLHINNIFTFIIN